MEGGQSVIEMATPFVVVFNLLVVAVILVILGRALTRGKLTAGVPDGRQNVAEFILSFFVGKAREMGGPKVVRVVAPFLATCFLLIFVSNLFVVLPIPVFNRPPTSYFGVTLGLALSAIIGTLVISGVFNGFRGMAKHLFWPNPLQLISEFTDVLSLSLRLFGNIAGEYMTIMLVSQAVVVGIPLILHIVGLIPAFVQALVFTLLTTSFVAGAIHHDEAREDSTEPATFERAGTGPVAIEGQDVAAMPGIPTPSVG
jgi:F-type H+-transporting ATPase subunit a